MPAPPSAARCEARGGGRLGGGRLAPAPRLPRDVLAKITRNLVNPVAPEVGMHTAVLRHDRGWLYLLFGLFFLVYFSGRKSAARGRNACGLTQAGLARTLCLQQPRQPRREWCEESFPDASPPFPGPSRGSQSSSYWAARGIIIPGAAGKQALGSD